VALSQRRADAVIRYLAVHNIPVRKIHVVAIGSEDPNAENKTRAERKENRRVDVRVYALNLNGTPAGAGNNMGAANNNMGTDMNGSQSSAAGASDRSTNPPQENQTPQQ